MCLDSRTGETQQKGQQQYLAREGNEIKQGRGGVSATMFI